MSLKQTVSKTLHGLRVGFIALTVFQFSLRGPLATSLQARDKENTRTPIKHVIVIIGENRTFDHVFATYVPKSQDSVSNLLSKGIIKADGTPGPHFSKAAQFQAVAPFKKEFFISLDKSEKTPYQILPQPTLNFSPIATIFPPRHLGKFLASHRALPGPRRCESADHRRGHRLSPDFCFA